MRLEHEKDFMYIQFTRIPKDKFLEHLKQTVAKGNYKDLEKRIRWDMFYAIPTNKRTEFYDRNPERTDAHIDSLLKYAMKQYCLHNNLPTALEAIVIK